MVDLHCLVRVDHGQLCNRPALPGHDLLLKKNRSWVEFVAVISTFLRCYKSQRQNGSAVRGCSFFCFVLRICIVLITSLATEARGVSVTQLDSIDPTLVVYKADATFVGVGLWDLYAAIASPGARPYWDKQHEDAILLEDVNELTELWHFKSRPTWPAKYVTVLAVFLHSLS